MFDIGGPELLLILLGIIVLFGPKKIPELAQMLGKGIQKVRSAQTQFKEQIDEIQTELSSVNKTAIDLKSDLPINEIFAEDLREEHFSNVPSSEKSIDDFEVTSSTSNTEADKFKSEQEFAQNPYKIELPETDNEPTKKTFDNGNSKGLAG